MKYGASLRIEFLIPGAATVAAIFWLMVVLGDAWGWSFHLRLMRAVAAYNPSSVHAILILLMLLSLAYTIGIIVVMATFYWPTNRLVQNLRAQRVEMLNAVQVESEDDGNRPLVGHLHRLFQNGPGKAEPVSSDLGSWWGSRRRWWHQLFAKPASTGHDLHLAVSLARSKMSAASQAEYEYRRSVRQLCIGIVPATLLCVLAAEVAIWRSDTYAVSLRAGAAALVLALGAAIASGLLASVQYQEGVAQWLLIDIAFLEYWEACGAVGERCPRCKSAEGANGRDGGLRKVCRRVGSIFAKQAS
ncbi:hypothetical protein [Melissospora conviva]|uniref:hypothetical protein n=1 Tax=Melissospora conviva TaxID=3388432 RepID=UPI003B79C0DA